MRVFVSLSLPLTLVVACVLIVFVRLEFILNFLNNVIFLFASAIIRTTLGVDVRVGCLVSLFLPSMRV